MNQLMQLGWLQEHDVTSSCYVGRIGTARKNWHGIVTYQSLRYGDLRVINPNLKNWHGANLCTRYVVLSSYDALKSF